MVAEQLCTLFTNSKQLPNELVNCVWTNLTCFKDFNFSFKVSSRLFLKCNFNILKDFPIFILFKWKKILYCSMGKNSLIIPWEMGKWKYFFHQSLSLCLGGTSAQIHNGQDWKKVLKFTWWYFDESYCSSI